MSGPGSRADPAASASRPLHLPAQYRTAIVGVLPFANLSDNDDEYFSDGLTEDLIHALSLQSFYRVLSRNSTFSFKGKNLSTRLIAREIDATYLIQGSVRRGRQQDPRHRRTDRAGERRAIMDRPIRPRHGRSVRDAGRDHHQSVRRDRHRNLPRGSIRSRPDVHRRHRMGPVPEGPLPLLPADQGGFRNLDRPVQGGDCARSGAFDRARLSRHHHGAGRRSLDGSRARANCGPPRWISPKAAFGSIPARPSLFRSCPICTRWRAITTRPWTPSGGRSS